MAKELTESQLNTIEITERVCSVLSVLGTSFIIATFLASKAFHKPINRLVFYASIGNILANVGTLVSRSGILVGGGLCQFQGFLIQLFLPADAMWTLAMACNVYLTFFRKYDARQLRNLEWKYIVACYGIPFIPAFVFFFIKTGGRGKVYGNAVLWCWISLKWDWLRIALFYGPVWVIILVTFIIYIVAGREIFQKRKQLRDFSSNNYDAPYPMVDNPFVSTKTTEVQITSEPVQVSEDDSSQLSLKREAESPGKTGPFYPYSVTIGSVAKPPGQRERSMIGTAAGGNKPGERVRGQRTAAMEANRAAFSYARCAMLFFIAILVTWVPSTINRVYSLVHPEDVSFALNYISALVLPLQGFWNALIYVITSLPACRRLWKDITSMFEKNSRPITTIEVPRTINKNRAFSSRSIGQESLTSLDQSESMKGFART